MSNSNLGYDPNFLGEGINIPLPRFNRSLAQSVLRKQDKLRDEIYSDHLHFTIVMNKDTRQLIYSAQNIDQQKFREDAGGKKGWSKVKEIGSDFQLGNEYYKDRKNSSGTKIPNPYDRGHMVMRFNNMWGKTKEEANKAGKGTFIYANSSLQHENLNRDEWKELELNVIRTFTHDANDKLTVFTGPIYGDLDRHINLSDRNSARVPSGFFKVVCYRTKSNKENEKLGVLAFAIFQDKEVLRDKKGKSTVKTNRNYQLTISELQNLTGINFGDKLYDLNPLFYHTITERNEKYNVPDTPERIPIGVLDKVITDPKAKRENEEVLTKSRVIINSAMINPKSPESKGEWVSLYNRSTKTINLDNWSLIDGKGRKALIKGSIKSGESIRLKGKNKGKIKLANNGGSLMLYDKKDCLIDHVTWSKAQIDKTEEEVAFMFAHE